MPNLFRRWRNDRSGSTAVEFAIVAAPFFMFVFALIGISYYYFVINSVEKGMDQSSRLIRTGQAVSDKMTVDQFKKKICDGAGDWIKCENLQVFVKHYANWAGLVSDAPQECLDSNQVIIQNTTPGNQLIAIESGNASDVVIVTACYLWKFTANFPFLKIGNMKNGSMMVQSATAFRSEPYPES
ncbi:TadE/TadG family type IV pilus assembly protein [Hyphomicrobium methylovorum]|uniref:TadE/TadG family type IV pilus assembly protein n=1 Tax=Hyphomicrobium methylovorum TaxID=84 RepID=UPI001FEC091F|nr:TadE/TadG family type IV pilus assembly protein [Hyphomicrobium methylovorum]